jgi:hypothetical protein
MVGNTPNYVREDILRCLLLIPENHSRKSIMKRLSLGEGSVRALLDILKQRHLINSSRAGHFLTEKGEKLLSKILKVSTPPAEIKSDELFPNQKKAAILIRSHPSAISPVQLRDVAVRSGADGALILKYERGRFNLGFSYHQDFSFLKKYFKPQEGNLAVIAFGKNFNTCERASLSVLCELHPWIKRI